MLRVTAIFIGLILWAGAGASAQMAPPPPEGPPQAADPYAQGGPAENAPNPALLAKARVWFANLQAGHINRSQLEVNENANMSDETVAKAQHLIGSLGKPLTFVQKRSGSQAGVTYGIYLVTFKNGQQIDFLFALDDQGKVASLGLGSPH